MDGTASAARDTMMQSRHPQPQRRLFERQIELLPAQTAHTGVGLQWQLFRGRARCRRVAGRGSRVAAGPGWLAVGALRSQRVSVSGGVHGGGRLLQRARAARRVGARHAPAGRWCKGIRLRVCVGYRGCGLAYGASLCACGHRRATALRASLQRTRRAGVTTSARRRAHRPWRRRPGAGARGRWRGKRSASAAAVIPSRALRIFSGSRVRTGAAIGCRSGFADAFRPPVPCRALVAATSSFKPLQRSTLRRSTGDPPANCQSPAITLRPPGDPPATGPGDTAEISRNAGAVLLSESSRPPLSAQKRRTQPSLHRKGLGFLVPACRTLRHRRRHPMKGRGICQDTSPRASPRVSHTRGPRSRNNSHS